MPLVMPLEMVLMPWAEPLSRMSSASRSFKSADSTRIAQASTAVVVWQMRQVERLLEQGPMQAPLALSALSARSVLSLRSVGPVISTGNASSIPRESKNTRRRSSSSFNLWLRINSARFQLDSSSQACRCRGCAKNAQAAFSSSARKLRTSAYLMQGELAGSAARASIAFSSSTTIWRSPITSTTCSGGSGIRARRILAVGTETVRDRIPRTAAVVAAAGVGNARLSRTAGILTANVRPGARISITSLRTRL